MDEQRAIRILTDHIDKHDNSNFLYSQTLNWEPEYHTANVATLEGDFTVDELEALVWWMKNKKETARYRIGGSVVHKEAFKCIKAGLHLQAPKCRCIEVPITESDYINKEGK